MKRAVCYVFSGTGNTQYAAEQIRLGLEALGWKMDLYAVRAPLEAPPDPTGYDAALFGYPIHAFNSPKFFLNFVKGLPRVQGLPAYIFKTSGEPFRLNAASSDLLCRALSERGFRPKMDLHMLMPYNIMFRYPDGAARQMARHTGRMCRHLAGCVANGAGEAPHFSLFYRGLSCLFRIQWLGARLNGPLYRVKKDLCSGCGKCAARCPGGNIRMEGGKPRFGRDCTMCMACAMGCPQDAVRPGLLSHWRVNGPYDFSGLEADEQLPEDFFGEARGYFGLFRTYYEETERELAAEPLRET